MRKVLRFFLGLAACVVLLFSAYQLYDYFVQTNASKDLLEGLAEDAVVVKTLESEAAPNDSHSTTAGAAPWDSNETAPIEVDFTVLQETNPDVIGWLYCPDTPINLPVVQAEDNDYYLRRLPDGSWNNAGTLFADYRNAGDFSGWNTIIYGHNMKNDSMLGTLPNYSKQEYYAAHPVMWLLTPERDYKIELVAGYVTSSTSDIYCVVQTDEEALALAQNAVQASDFTTDIPLEPGDRFVTLSTCSYEYDNARYVLVGRLVPLGEA